MTDRRNLFAYTPPHGNFPPYISINEHGPGGAVEVTVRSPLALGGHTASIIMARPEFEKMRGSLAGLH